MHTKIQISLIVLIVLYFPNLARTENLNETEKTNELLDQLVMLKDIVTLLETDIEKLYKGIDQQSEVLYNNSRTDFKETIEVTHESSFNCSENIQEFYNDLNKKLLNLNKNAENSLQTHYNALSNKTQEVALQILESLNQCLVNTTPAGEVKISDVLAKFGKQIERFDSIKQKIDNLNKKEQELEENSESISKMMAEINTMLDSQNQNFEFLEKQLPVLQSASRTLDEYIIRRNQRLNYHHNHPNCFDGKPHKFGSPRHH